MDKSPDLGKPCAACSRSLDRVENAPLLISQIAPTQCCLLQKGSLESKLDSSVKNWNGFSSPVISVDTIIVPSSSNERSMCAANKMPLAGLSRSRSRSRHTDYPIAWRHSCETGLGLSALRSTSVLLFPFHCFGRSSMTAKWPPFCRQQGHCLRPTASGPGHSLS